MCFRNSDSVCDGSPFPWVGWCQSFNTEIGVTGQALEVRNQLFSKLSQSFLSLWMGSTHDPVSWILHTSVSSRVNDDDCICVLCVYNFYIYIEYASNTMTKLYVQAHWLLVEEYLGKPVCMIVIIVWWIQVNTPQPSFHVFIVWLDLVERFGCKPWLWLVSPKFRDPPLPEVIEIDSRMKKQSRQL